jgi:hypothetical protein
MDGSSGSSGGEGRAGAKEAPGATASGTGAGAGSAPAPDMTALARDWIELWQSELTALAADPETIDGWGRLAALWAGAAASGIAAMPRGAQHDRHAPFPGVFAGGFPGPFGPTPPWPAAAWPTPGAGPAAPPGAAAAPAASEPGGVATERLLQRVLDRLDAIEQRLAALEGRGSGGAGRADRSRAGRSRG